jgi:hypothetical protein
VPIVQAEDRAVAASVVLSFGVRLQHAVDLRQRHPAFEVVEGRGYLIGILDSFGLFTIPFRGVTSPEKIVREVCGDCFDVAKHGFGARITKLGQNSSLIRAQVKVNILHNVVCLTSRSRTPLAGHAEGGSGQNPVVAAHEFLPRMRRTLFRAKLRQTVRRKGAQIHRVAAIITLKQRMDTACCQSYLMQEEPEAGCGFSYKMSLKEEIGMLGIDTKSISLEQMRAFVAAGGSAEFQVETGRTESPSTSAASPIPTDGLGTCASTPCIRETGWVKGLYPINAVDQVTQ